MRTHPVIRLDEIGSTNTYALEILASERPEEGTVVITGNQTRGRGLEHNTWESEPGANLTFSLILYPGIGAEKQFLLNKAVSLGIYDFLDKELEINHVKIKWPNDIYISNQKVCGMLIQHAVTGYKFDYSVIGIGLNVNQKTFRSEAPNPVSLSMVTGFTYDLDNLLEGLLRSIDGRYEQLLLGHFSAIEGDYRQVLYRLNEWHIYLINELPVTAMITGTGEYGRLLLQTDDNRTLQCDLKEIRFTL